MKPDIRLIPPTWSLVVSGHPSDLLFSKVTDRHNPERDYYSLGKKVAMPMYEYQCLKCEHRFEELIRNPKDKEKLVCTACGSPKVFKVLSCFAVKNGTSSASQDDAASCRPAPPGGGGFS